MIRWRPARIAESQEKNGEVRATKQEEIQPRETRDKGAVVWRNGLKCYVPQPIFNIEEKSLELR